MVRAVCVPRHQGTVWYLGHLAGWESNWWKYYESPKKLASYFSFQLIIPKCRLFCFSCHLSKYWILSTKKNWLKNINLDVYISRFLEDHTGIPKHKFCWAKLVQLKYICFSKIGRINLSSISNIWSFNNLKIHLR